VGSDFRFALAVTFILGSALFLHVRRESEVIPPHRQLASFPQAVRNWDGRDEKIDPEVLDILGPGDFLARSYQQNSSNDPPIDLFVAYVPSQRIGNTLHSPKNCLPGTGWSELNSSKVAIPLPSGETFVANRYLVSKGAQRGIVFYWYWAHGRSNASEYWAKATLIEESIRFNRSDGALIRFSTELKQHESEATAEKRLMSLLRYIVPVLEPYLQG
jgi:EpsI family protein